MDYGGSTYQDIDSFHVTNVGDGSNYRSVIVCSEHCVSISRLVSVNRFKINAVGNGHYSFGEQVILPDAEIAYGFGNRLNLSEKPARQSIRYGVLPRAKNAHVTST